jgi:uncharacterized protein (DUF4415 family)
MPSTEMTMTSYYGNKKASATAGATPPPAAESVVPTTRYQNKKTESVTLRLDKDVLDKLRKESNDKQISFNTLSNQIFIQHLNWHAHAAKAGFISIRKSLLINMLEKMPEQEVLRVAEDLAKKESKNFILMLRNEYSITTALDVLETWLKVVGYHYRHEVKGSEHSYIIQHDMGRKWSLYLSKLFGFIAEDFELPRVDFDESESILSFRVDIGAALLK